MMSHSVSHSVSTQLGNIWSLPSVNYLQSTQITTVQRQVAMWRHVILPHRHGTQRFSGKWVTSLHFTCCLQSYTWGSILISMWKNHFVNMTRDLTFIKIFRSSWDCEWGCYTTSCSSNLPFIHLSLGSVFLCVHVFPLKYLWILILIWWFIFVMYLSFC